MNAKQTFQTRDVYDVSSSGIVNRLDVREQPQFNQWQPEDEQNAHSVLLGKCEVYDVSSSGLVKRREGNEQPQLNQWQSNDEQNAVGKCADDIKKLKKKKPQKPVSPYALFFRDTHAAIRSQNPNATFNEVSKIVFSMWNALDREHWIVYEKKAEAAEKEYLEYLSYEANMLGKDDDSSNSPTGEEKSSLAGTAYSPKQVPDRPTQSHTSTSEETAFSGGMVYSPKQVSDRSVQSHSSITGDISPFGGVVFSQKLMTDRPIQSQPQVVNIMKLAQMRNDSTETQQMKGTNNIMNTTPNSSPVHVKLSNQQTSVQQQINQSGNLVMNSSGIQNPNPSPDHNNSIQKCIRDGCNNQAVVNPDWEDEYCSNECVIIHCRNVFSQWVQANTGQTEILP